MKLTIGLTYAPPSDTRYGNYAIAVGKAAKVLEYDVEVIDLASLPMRITDCDGIIFTGGADVSPERYGKGSESYLCADDVDDARDTLEFAFAREAEAKRLPTLGICRGAQLLNIHHGGTLLTDIQHFGGAAHTRPQPGVDRRHGVTIQPGSLVARLSGETEGEINSAHHQAIERVGDGLTPIAWAEDGTIEAVELQDPKNKPFFLAVQWHPERMNFDEPFSGKLFESFLFECATNSVLRDRLATPAKKNG
jgi:putative glutamine amidotransferase